MILSRRFALSLSFALAVLPLAGCERSTPPPIASTPST